MEQIEQLKTENAQLKKQIAQSGEVDNEKYVLDLVGKGVILPCAKDKAVELLNYASSYDNGEVMNFNEGESLLSKIKDLLASQPVFIHLNREISANDRYLQSEDTLQYASDTPKEAVALDKRIRIYMKENSVDYQTAFNALHQKGVK